MNQDDSGQYATELRENHNRRGGRAVAKANNPSLKLGQLLSPQPKMPIAVATVNDSGSAHSSNLRRKGSNIFNRNRREDSSAKKLAENNSSQKSIGLSEIHSVNVTRMKKKPNKRQLSIFE